MKQRTIQLAILFLLLFCINLSAQSNPAILNWIQNHDGATGRHYVEGNSTPIEDDVLANLQSVDYSTEWVYITATGIPTYITGPFLDGNTSLALDQEAIYRFPLSPEENTGTPENTRPGNNGAFINGVSVYDYRDGVGWDDEAGSLCGGPGGAMCPGGRGAILDWNRDAILAEMTGFDCAKAHPDRGNYHHHQNPSAFNLDLMVVSDICDAYPADGLYVIDTNNHSPLIAFAYDGFPIYGSYGYANLDGTGGIVRIQSSYELRGATTREAGPDISAYFEGYFREDYVFVSHTEPFYLDDHNGRFAVTPEYPEGTYAYYATVDENHNSAYPYLIGPTYYGNVVGGKVDSIDETTTNYDSSLSVDIFDENNFNITVYPNPSQDFIAIQSNILHENLKLELINELGQVVLKNEILKGSTLSIMETHALYNGIYFLKITTSNYNNKSKTYKVVIKK